MLEQPQSFFVIEKATKIKKGQLAGNFIAPRKAYKGSPETTRRITFSLISSIQFKS